MNLKWYVLLSLSAAHGLLSNRFTMSTIVCITRFALNVHRFVFVLWLSTKGALKFLSFYTVDESKEIPHKKLNFDFKIAASILNLRQRHSVARWFEIEDADPPQRHNDLRAFRDPVRRAHAHSSIRTLQPHNRRIPLLWAIALHWRATMLAEWKSPASYVYPNCDFFHDIISTL